MKDVLVWTGRLSVGVLGFSGRIHNIVDGYRVLCRTIILLYRINYLSLSYNNLQPVSYQVLVDTKVVWARTGITITT